MMRKYGPLIFLVVALVAFTLSLPPLLALTLRYEQGGASAAPAQFPVTVDPVRKVIVENPQVNALLENRSPFQAAAGNVGGAFWGIFAWVASAIGNAPWYQDLASVVDGNKRFVTITPGMRKEQAAQLFADALSWNTKEKKQFLTPAASSTLPLAEGSFAPGTYAVVVGMSPAQVQALVNSQFTQDVLVHYGTTTESIVPLDEALTIASLIEREAGGADDRRIISGIIWNRLFSDMNLQIDATVQYAKANVPWVASWWPRILPSDLSRKSPYNTYINSGLPPTPIANPSVDSILAALNPKQTSCMFYFHDNAGQFHCTDTYPEHVALLKKYFGRGK